MIFLKEFKVNTKDAVEKISKLFEELYAYFGVDNEHSREQLKNNLLKDAKRLAANDHLNVSYRFYLSKKARTTFFVINREQRKFESEFSRKLVRLVGNENFQGNYAPIKQKSYRFELPLNSKSKTQQELFRFISRHLHGVEKQDVFIQSRNIELEMVLDELKDNQEALYKANMELRELALQLAAKNQEITEFSYVVSHDLKGPLNNMVNLIDLMHIKSQKPNVDIEPYLNAGRHEVAKMRLFIERVLDYCKAGEEMKSFKTIDLNEFFKQFFTEHSYAKPVSYKPLGLKTLRYSVEELEIICNNLFSNAVKYNTNQLVEIEISQSKKNPRQLSFSDNGIGIKEEFRHQIFNFGSILSNKGNTTSSGVGLALVKRIIEKYDGGKIWLDENFQPGSKFHVVFGER